MLFDLQPESVEQLGFNFEAEEATRPPKLMAAMDALNQRFGKGTLVVGSSAQADAPRSWQMQQERKSPSYTTDWDNLPVVR